MTMSYQTLNPATGKLVESYPLDTEAQVGRKLERASKSFGTFRRTSFAERAAMLTRCADLLESRADELARTMALEMGKVLAEGVGEAKKCAWVCRYYAAEGEGFQAPRRVESDGSEAWVHYEPLGPVLAIMPWNFPLWQVFRFVAPALALGNVALLKHAPSTPRCALAIESLLSEAGVPEAVFQNLFLSNEQAARVIADPAVRGVTITGSTGAGREVAATAGRALKPIVTELGGSDPFIVFADADLDAAIAAGVGSRCLNNGQSCIAAKRFLVEKAVMDEFLEAFVAAMEKKKVGDPCAEGTEIGPLARSDLRLQLAQQVERCVAQGAQVRCGGKMPEGAGFYYPPTVLTGLDPEAPAAKEEHFGPVAVVYPFDGEAEALALANGTSFGLGVSLWSEDRERVWRLIPQLETGSVFVNGFVKSDPRLPFGGVKDSGFGRELSSEGMLEFANIKTVWIR